MAPSSTQQHRSAGRRRAFRATAAGLTLMLTTTVGPGNPAWAKPTHHSHHPVNKVGGAVSGTWAGSYSGNYNGTFKLAWKQTGEKLSGTISVSALGTTSVNGTLNGSSISFGTVGSQSITYPGSVSGRSMSGTWKIREGLSGPTMGSGSWKATKLSDVTVLPPIKI